MRWLALVMLAGCYAPSPPAGLPCADGSCPAGQTCVANVCVADVGVVDASTTSGDGAAPDCVCTGDELACPGQANVTCPLGCLVDTSDAGRCAELVPSNGATRADLEGATFDAAAFTKLVLEVDTGEVRLDAQVIRGAGEGLQAGIRYRRTNAAGVPVAIFAFASLDVAEGSLLAPVRSNYGAGETVHAVILLVGGDVTIAGTLAAMGGTNEGCLGITCSGPGGGRGANSGGDAAGCSPGESALGTATGGGGGGHGSPGGDGPHAGGSNPSAGGSACAIAEITALVGGSGGGEGYRAASSKGRGGGGGGAVQVTSLTGIRVDGEIHAGGGGGEAPGGGGGAGGTILLEAPQITVAGCVAAGGAGGAGGGIGTGHQGTTATCIAGAAPGGASGTLQAGGDGAAQGSPAGDGGDAVGSLEAGGGGGGLGRVIVRTGRIDSDGAVINPTFVSVPAVVD